MFFEKRKELIMRKQILQYNNFYIGLFLALILGVHSNNYVLSQEVVNFPLNQESFWYNENYSAYYVSSGFNSPDGVEVKWQNAEWVKCVRTGKTWDCDQPLMTDPSYPPYAPTQGDANNVYIYIHGNDVIRLDSVFDYKNQLTLEICGELYIANIEIDVPVPFVEMEAIVNNLDSTVNLSGSYTSFTSLSDFDEKEVGFSIVPAQGYYEIYSPVHFLPLEGFDFDYNENTSINNDGDSIYHAIFNLNSVGQWRDSNGDLQVFNPDLAYNVVAYAVNDAGYGFSNLDSIIFSETTKSSETFADLKEEVIEDEEDNMNIFNGFRLWICENGLLELGAISVKNNAEFHVDGTFIVTEAIIEAGNNYCFTGTGIIADSYEYLEHPDVNELPFPGDGLANNCPGFDGVPLPVELMSFSYKSSPEFLELEWVTATEINNDFFTIERSSDLYAWEIVGYVQGVGTTSEMQHYSYRDHSPREGISYYRLKQTDFDGKFEYFDPLSVIYMPGADGLDFRVARHPDQWTIFVPGEGAYHIEMYDLTGRKIYSDMVVNNITIPAPGQTVVVRVFNDRNHSASRVVM